jgi:GNAT superfamily N-acetyltransferase
MANLSNRVDFMEKEIIYREIQPGEENEACLMVIDCFNEYVAPGYSDMGIIEFLKYVVPDLMQRRLAQGNFVIVALIDGLISGIIEICCNDHIALFFVKKEYHRMGIAKKLLELAINKCKQTGSDIKVIEVNSSPFAVPIYEKLGFVTTNTEQMVNEIKFTPMIFNLNPSAISPSP